MIGRFRLRQDVADEAPIEALAASKAFHRFRLDQARGKTLLAWRACHADLTWRVRADGHAISARKINRVGRAWLENTAATAELAPRPAFGLDAYRAAQDDDAYFVRGVRPGRDLLVRREPVRRKADVFPTGGFRGHPDDLRALPLRFDEQTHAIPLTSPCRWR